MTTAAALLSELARRGVILTPRDDAVGYRAPRGALTPELRAAMSEHKEGLVALLAGAQVEAGADWRPRLGESWPAAWNDGRCVRCDGRRWRWSAARQRWECADAECEAKGQALWKGRERR